jgi:hypothetical protein
MNDKRGNRQRQNETAANSGGAAAELRIKCSGVEGFKRWRLSEKTEVACGWGFWLWAKRRVPSIPTLFFKGGTGVSPSHFLTLLAWCQCQIYTVKTTTRSLRGLNAKTDTE